ncbi:MAG: AAA family ATPase [Methanomassiliicoccales archaeon]|nr:AAA family ATPase [Methanomassiliicoccales archaeon]
MNPIKTLAIEYYRAVHDPDLLGFDATDSLRPTKEIIGQERAQRALHFGLEIQDQGFNIYVSGMPGTGRQTAVCKFLRELASTKPKADDWVYVNNFTNKYEPIAIRLPAGLAIQLRADMAAFIEEVEIVLPRAFESEEYENRRKEALGKLAKEREETIELANQRAEKRGFFIQIGPIGLMINPMIDGRPMTTEEFDALPEKEQDAIIKRRERLDAELMVLFRKIREIDIKSMEVISKLNSEIALYAIGPLLSDLLERYGGIQELRSYIENVQKDILENLDLFLGVPQPQTDKVPPKMQQLITKDMAFRNYEVNILVDNGSTVGAPVVFEDTPSYLNLLGRAEKDVQFGVVSTDFTMIRPGSLHKANGGYLVLPVLGLFKYPWAWEGLKSALKRKKVRIEEPGEQAGFITTRGLKPHPIPLNLKVVLIGTPEINQLLHLGDPDYPELFKVRADFDDVMDRNEDNLDKYSVFICTLCEHFDLKHLDKYAVAKMMEYGSRLADDRRKLSTRFASVADIIKEANFYALRDGSRYIKVEHIQEAIDEKLYRSNMVYQKIQEYIEQGVILIDIEGSKVGQINGLSFMEMGDIDFGRPSRVTASVSVGRDGIVDIERQAQMGGPLHTKGVLIIGGYLSGKYTQDKPLSLNARIVFEQSYGGVDGDSASSTELYAILSALSDLPIKQNIAVTGSVNQKGEVQAIGGINEKLEGFFDVCKAKGLTGEQGAMIPVSNVQNLMLKEEIIEAAKDGNFTIYPVETIDQGIEVLTGVPAGERRADGSYEEGTVNYLVDKRLREMAETVRDFQAYAR